MLQKDVEARLGQFKDAYLGKTLSEVKAIKRISVENEQILIDIVLKYPIESIKMTMVNEIAAFLQPLSAGKQLVINLTSQVDAHVGKLGVQGLPKVKNIIAVASGKGGVGKSTVAVNLALALAKDGAQVGLLDADIYGPSQPTMVGAAGARPVIKDKTIQPIRRHGIQTMSIGYLVDPEAAMMWRGPMLGKALEQLMYDTVWEDLDYLIIDLPPGTGDVQLTLCQKIPVSAAVIVTTPQDLALVDVRRACEMFNKLDVPILGVVENMSIFHCSNCGHEEHIFGEGGGAKLAHEYGLSVLGSIPLHLRIRELTDAGQPPAASDTESPYAKAFYQMARMVAAKLSLQPKDYSGKFPNIVVASQTPPTKPCSKKE